MIEKLLSFFFIRAQASGELPEGRVFALDIQTFIGVAIQILNIIILAVILYKVLYKPVKNMLDQRSENIANQFKDAESKDAQAQELIDDYEARLESIHEERDQILDEARIEGEEEKARIIAEAQEEAEKIKADAKRGLDTERQLMQRDMRDYVIELSTLLAEKTLEDSVGYEIQEEQFEEGLKDLEVSSWQN